MPKPALLLCLSLLFSMSHASITPTASAQETSALIKTGRSISKIHCTRCHVVADFNPHGGISSTPSFSLLVNQLEDWEIRFLSFHTRRPHPVIIRFKGEEVDLNNPPPTTPIELEYSDIEAIAAFAKTLKKSAPNE